MGRLKALMGIFVLLGLLAQPMTALAVSATTGDAEFIVPDGTSGTTLIIKQDGVVKKEVQIDTSKDRVLGAPVVRVNDLAEGYHTVQVSDKGQVSEEQGFYVEAGEVVRPRVSIAALLGLAWWFSIGPMITYEWGNFDGEVHSQGGTNQDASTDFDLDGKSLGVEGTIHWPTSCGMPGYFWWAYLASNAKSKAGGLDLHAGANVDTFGTLSELGILMTAFAYPLWIATGTSPRLTAHLALLAGLAITWHRMEIFSDETGGGGNVEHSKDTDMNYGPLFGFRYSHPVRCFSRYIALATMVNVLALTYYVPDIQSHRFSTFTNNNYRARADSGWKYHLGLGMTFMFDYDFSRGTDRMRR